MKKIILLFASILCISTIAMEPQSDLDSLTLITAINHNIDYLNKILNNESQDFGTMRTYSPFGDHRQYNVAGVFQINNNYDIVFIEKNNPDNVIIVTIINYKGNVSLKQLTPVTDPQRIEIFQDMLKTKEENIAYYLSQKPKRARTIHLSKP